MVACTRSSVSRSTAAVASSRTSTCVQGRQVSGFAGMMTVYMRMGKTIGPLFWFWRKRRGHLENGNQTLVFLRRALAKQMSCLWPTLRFSPPSVTCICDICDICDICGSAWFSYLWHRSDSDDLNHEVCFQFKLCRVVSIVVFLFLTVMKLIFLIIAQRKW